MKIEPVAAPKTTIQVIERMVALLDALAKYTDPVSLKELSKVSGLHPSTAHRILNDMVLTRFVDRISLELHPLSKNAKDFGSAAVLLTCILAFATWSVVLFNRFY